MSGAEGPAPATLLRVIDNARPDLTTAIEHVLHLPHLCPVTLNPVPGSTLSLRYEAGPQLLELFSLDAYIDAFIGHPVVRDMEFFVQTVAQDAANLLGAPVTAHADVTFNRLRQGQRVTVTAQPAGG